MGIFSHTHGHSHGASESSDSHGDCSPHPPSAPNALLRALIITLIFFVVELVGGWLSNSLTLLSDAAHMLTDAGSLLFSLLILLWTQRALRKNPQTHPGETHWIENWGAIISGLALWAVAGYLIYESIERIHTPEPVRGGLALTVSAIGLAANLFSLRLLHGSVSESPSVKAAYLHVWFDLFGSLGALISSLVITLGGSLLVDPILTIVFSLVMLGSTGKLIVENWTKR